MCLFLIHWRILKKEGKTTVSHFLVHCGEACFAAVEGNNFSTSPLVRRCEARFVAAKLGPNFLVRSSEARFAAVKLGPNFLVRSSEATFIATRLNPSLLRSMSSPQRRDPSPWRSDSYSDAYKYPRLSIFFSPPIFCATLCLLLLSGMCFVCKFIADHDYYGSQEDRARKTTPL